MATISALRWTIWDLILKYKQGDTYGDGYKLTLVKKQSEGRGFQPPSLSPSSSLSPCSEVQVTQFIRQFVASCLLVSDSNTELSYVLPSEAVKKGCFERLFQFGVMDTTLEEVFLKVSEEDQSLENSDAGKSSIVEPEKPTVELNNLVKCSTLSQSQSSLMSSSSVGSVRGDEGGLYTDFYGDYCPLFDNRQGLTLLNMVDIDSISESESESEYFIDPWGNYFLLQCSILNQH
uniref:Uncharacterized protein n=1 Tax=Maylandia zebra TaxID=106582 RepID=A0A3P9CQA8_9CICH